MLEQSPPIADFDPGAGTFNMISTGFTDIFVSKLDASGNFVWAKRMGGTGWDECYSIVVDSSGNVYTTGYFRGTVDFDPGAGTFNMTSAGGTDIFVSKLDLLGNFVWAIPMGGALNDYGTSIVLDGSANVYVMGDQYSGTVDFDPGAGVYNVNNTGTEANFIAQYDNSGNFRCAFAITPGHNEAHYNHHLAVAGSNIYITASFDIAGTDLDPCPPVYNLPNNNGYDIYVAKYDMSNCNCVPPPPPVANFTASDTMICEGDCINFTDLSTGTPTSWQWSFPGGIPSTSTSQNPTNICYDTAGFYDVQLIATNTNGSDTLIKTGYIQVDTCPLPTANFTASDTVICEGDCINFTNLSTDTPTSWQWSFPGATPSTSIDQNPINICYDTAGIYEVELIATNTFGSDTLTKIFYIAVYPSPMVNIGNDTSICEGDSIILEAGNPGANFLWSIGDTTQAITVSDTGSYFVEVTDSNNCTSIDTININMQDCDIAKNIFFIPNSFSPNGDGKNDTLFVRGKGIERIKLYIYNRWGEKVFESNNIKKGWDGTYRKKPLNTAVFAWYAEVEFNDTNNPGQIYRKGNVTLMR